MVDFAQINYTALLPSQIEPYTTAPNLVPQIHFQCKVQTKVSTAPPPFPSTFAFFSLGSIQNCPELHFQLRKKIINAGSHTCVTFCLSATLFSSVCPKFYKLLDINIKFYRRKYVTNQAEPSSIPCFFVFDNLDTCLQLFISHRKDKPTTEVVIGTPTNNAGAQTAMALGGKYQVLQTMHLFEPISYMPAGFRIPLSPTKQTTPTSYLLLHPNKFQLTQS